MGVACCAPSVIQSNTLQTTPRSPYHLYLQVNFTQPNNIPTATEQSPDVEVIRNNENYLHHDNNGIEPYL